MGILQRHATLKKLVRANITIKKVVNGPWITYLIFQKVPYSGFYKGASPAAQKELKKYISETRNKGLESFSRFKTLKEEYGFGPGFKLKYRDVYKGFARGWVGHVRDVVKPFGQELKTGLNSMKIYDNERIVGLEMLYPEAFKQGWGVGGTVFDYAVEDLTRYTSRYIFAYAAHGPILPLLKKRGFKEFVNYPQPHWIKRVR